MEELKKQVEKLTADLAKVTSEATAAKKTFETQIASKDALIATKNDDLVKARNSHKTEIAKLKELTDADKAEMSKREIELHNGMLAMQKQKEEQDNERAEYEKGQAETAAKTIAYNRSEAIKKIVGTNPELTAQIEANYSRLMGADKATTPGEIEKLVNESFNMLGVARPNGVSKAMGGPGGEAGDEGDKKNFADSPEGAALAAALNIMPKAPGSHNKPAPAPAPVPGSLEASIKI